MSNPIEESGLDQAVGWVVDDTLRDWLTEQLHHVPEYFWTMPASTSGKHHPQFALGEGGLVRHTRACVYYALELGNSQGLSSDDLDKIIAALVLHDSWKQGTNPQGHTVWEHPQVAADWITDGVPTGSVRSEIGGMVRSHMGLHGWGPVEPRTSAQWLVHTCDYLASRRLLDLDLTETQV